MSVVEKLHQNDTAAILRACHQRQRDAYLADPVPSLEQRRKDLQQLRAMINDNREQFIEAISKDYGNRARQESQFAELIAVTDQINDAIKNLKKWSKPQKRHVDMQLYPGAKNRVIPQPLGVVGVIVPWNFPGNLSFSPLTAAFAAGNRAMVKMSENSRHFAQLLINISGKYFPEEKLMFFDESGGVGIEFSQIPFDLLFFTGSGATGRKVMESAAKNLTPVILELGGKSPAVIAPDFPMEKAVQRMMFVKMFNCGQICTNVDYVFVHKSQLDAFVQNAKAWVAEHVPDIESKDYTSIIDDRSFQRLVDTVKDARDKGATIVNLSASGQEPNPATRKMPLTLVMDTSEDMIIRNRETFGPLLMVMTYEKPDEVIAYVNSKDRPLAFYPFSNDKKLVEMYLNRIMSGGVTVNDALFHVGQHDLPFGGVGPSGMGHYHGYDGFLTFSKMRPIFYQAGFSAMKFLQPPYGKFATFVYNFLMKFRA